MIIKGFLQRQQSATSLNPRGNLTETAPGSGVFIYPSAFSMSCKGLVYDVEIDEDPNDSLYRGL